MFIEKSTKILQNHKKIVSLHSELSNTSHKIRFKMPFNFNLFIMHIVLAILRGLTDQLVHVRSYVRTRYGREEHVCEHYRRYPNSTIQL